MGKIIVALGSYLGDLMFLCIIKAAIDEVVGNCGIDETLRHNILPELAVSLVNALVEEVHETQHDERLGHETGRKLSQKTLLCTVPANILSLEKEPGRALQSSSTLQGTKKVVMMARVVVFETKALSLQYLQCIIGML